MKTQTIGPVRLAFVDRGQGEPVLLIHGFPLDHAMWDAQVEALSPRFRVIAPDLRGFGASEAPGDKTTMEDMADDMAALLASLEIDRPAVVCGLSMGGYVAWQIWRRHPRRVRALVLCDTRAAADTPEAAAGRQATADRVLREGPGVLAETMLPKLLAAETPQRRPEVAAALRRMIQGNNPQGLAAALRGMAQRPDVTAMLPAIGCPTLVIVGRHDAISTVGEMRGIAGAIRGAGLVEIEGAGHMTPMENPAEVNAAMLAFLAELE